MFKQVKRKVAVPTTSRQCAEMSLPPSDTVRWVASRKIMVLAAIDAGSLSIEEACLMYRLSIEEIASWSRLTELHGSDGLKISRLGEYRKGEKISAGRSPS